jgi:NAD(P)-dependent dehydrogenase (short-subunit alcohol dehydrogenase family)
MSGRVALVTGGGGGLGEAICRTLAEAGATVLATDVRVDQAGEVARSIRAAGGDATAVSLDVSDDQQAAEVIREAVSTHGSLDVLVNNAATNTTGPFNDLPMAEFDRILDVNLRGAVLMAKLVLPEMRRQGRGHIVNIASTAAKRAWPNASAYHTSKWGLLGFSHALFTEARAFGVRVTAVLPGGMRTPFLLESLAGLDPNLLLDPVRVAETIRFLLTQPDGGHIPEVTVVPTWEISWP